jgi:hypothetical protein
MRSHALLAFATAFFALSNAAPVSPDRVDAHVAAVIEGNVELAARAVRPLSLLSGLCSLLLMLALFFCFCFDQQLVGFGGPLASSEFSGEADTRANLSGDSAGAHLQGNTPFGDVCADASVHLLSLCLGWSTLTLDLPVE